MEERNKSAEQPIRVFYIYAQEDRMYRDQLDAHLSNLKRLYHFQTLFDREIKMGEDWEFARESNINAAHLIFLLISPSFMASDYIYYREMERALELHNKGEARVVPILVRRVHWQSAPFSHIPVLPSEEIPIKNWPDIDEAFYDVVRGIERIYQDFMRSRESLSLEAISSETNLEIYRLPKVFVKSGTPEITFVERDDFTFLKLALEQAGRGVVIEGPSGIGKTTSVEKAIEDFKKMARSPQSPVQQILRSRNPEHRKMLQNLREWHNGTIIIDDFHRLNFELRQELVDYLKELADISSENKKIAIVGIPRTGQALVDIAFDLATRLDVFRLGKVSQELILQMIEKGEKALNIQFDNRAEIVLAANGSFNIAQYLCFYLCALAGIVETQTQTQIVRCDILKATKEVLKELKMKFGQTVERFVSMGNSRDVTCLRLLEELALTEDGFLSLISLRENKPDVSNGIKRFIDENWMDKLYQEYPDAENHLFFDRVRQALIIDDPQLIFYLKQVRFSSLARESGKITTLAERKVFISYSHKDTEWLNRLRIHLKPIEREGIIDPWDDTKIAAGLQWREEIKNALETARVAILLVSADFLASDFIAEHELPTLLAHSKEGGTTIIPIILSPSLFSNQWC